jgi:hypothetical protein
MGPIVITAPSANAVFAAGPDYATDVLGDPWDMRNQQDVALDPAQMVGWNNTLTPANGLLTGVTNGTAGSFVTFLQRAWYMINNPGRTGRRYPIDTTKYTKISWKMSSTAGEFPRILFFQKDIGDPADVGSSRTYLNATQTPVPAGTTIYMMDMAQVNAPQTSGPAWTSGTVAGLSLYPNSGNGANTIGVSWMRITAGDGTATAKNMRVTWTGGTGSVAVNITDAGGTTYLAGSSSSGLLDFNYGILPPGTYTLNVGGTTQTFKINGPPTVQVTDPDETGGEDFATTMLHNPWDMADTGDYVVNVNIVDHLTQHLVNQPGFTGVSDGQTVGFTSGGVPVGDAQLYFLSQQHPQDGPLIDTTKYHRLTFGLYVEHAFSLATGSVARVFWGSDSSPTGGGTPYNLTTSKDIITWPGMNVYTLDLAAMTVANGGLEANNATPWTTQPVRHFRIDPFEFAEVVTFHYPFVKLAADDTTVGNRFTITFAGSDPENDTTTVSLYYDTDQNSSNGKTLIASGLPLLNGQGQYVWYTANVAPGTYYIYAEATDGLNTSGHYATGPLQVVAAPVPPVIRPNDFDGDKKADVAVYKATGDWAIDTSSSGYTNQLTKSWGGTGYAPVPGDYDGDGKIDVAVYQESSGNWSIVRSTDGTVLSINWGGPGYKPVQGDYDGDGKTDVGVYQASTGSWYILTSSSGYQSAIGATWGGSGYVAIGGQDFDGDGKADVAVYQISTGTWSILKSTTGYATPINVVFGGGPGYTLVPGDYDGDGMADLALYKRGTGVWSVLKSTSGYTTSFTVTLGGPGFLPVPGDFDGDGRIDPATYQPSTGTWSALKSTTNYQSQVTITNFGGPTDVPLSSAIAISSDDTLRSSDFDGDGKSDLTVYNASNGFWYSLKSSTNFSTTMNTSWGGSDYTPVPGDYDGDGKGDLGVYQQSSGNWYILLSGSNFTTTIVKNVGGPGWVPAQGDFDGDGRTDLVVYNTSSGLWYGLKSGANYTTTVSINWGGTGYSATPGDFDGDGKADLAVYQQSSGNWYILLSGANFTTTITKNVGGPGYVPLQGDFDGDGKADLAVYNTTSGLWYALKSSTNYTTTLAISWGGTGYTPVRGDFDGDGKSDLVLYQPSSGNWYILLSGANYTTTISKSWGGVGYAPVPAFP